MMLGSRLPLLLAHRSLRGIHRLLPKKIFHETVTSTATRTSRYGPRSLFSPMSSPLSLYTSCSGSVMHTNYQRPQIVIHPLILNYYESEEETNLYFINRPWPRVAGEQNREATVSRRLSLPTDFPRRATLHPQHCNGLWLLYSNTNCDSDTDALFNQAWFSSLEIMVVNPTTGDMDRLPWTREVYGELLKAPAIGYVSRTKEYKVVSITDSGDDDPELGVEVFTLGQEARNWRLLRPPVDPEKMSHGVEFCGCSFVLNEAIHWLLYFIKDASFGILRFHLETETFSFIPISIPKPKSEFWLHLLEIQGQVGVLTYASMTEKLEIWMLNDLGKGVSCVSSMNINADDIIPEGCLDTSWRVLSIGNGEIMISSQKCLFLLNISDGSFQVVSRRAEWYKHSFCLWPKQFTHYLPMEFALYQESLVSWTHPPSEDPADRHKGDDESAYESENESSDGV